MDERIALYCEQWDNPKIPTDLFRIGFDILFSELYKTIGKKVTFLAFRGNWPPVDPPLHWPVHSLFAPKYLHKIDTNCFHSYLLVTKAPPQFAPLMKAIQGQLPTRAVEPPMIFALAPASGDLTSGRPHDGDWRLLCGRKLTVKEKPLPAFGDSGPFRGLVLNVTSVRSLLIWNLRACCSLPQRGVFSPTVTLSTVQSAKFVSKIKVLNIYCMTLKEEIKTTSRYFLHQTMYISVNI